MVFGNTGVVIDDIVPSPCKTALNSLVSRVVLNVGVIGLASFRIEITLELTLAIVRVVGRESGLEVKTLDDVKLQINVTEQTP